MNLKYPDGNFTGNQFPKIGSPRIRSSSHKNLSFRHENKTYLWPISLVLFSMYDYYIKINQAFGTLCIWCMMYLLCLIFSLFLTSVSHSQFVFLSLSLLLSLVHSFMHSFSLSLSLTFIVSFFHALFLFQKIKITFNLSLFLSLSQNHTISQHTLSLFLPL